MAVKVDTLGPDALKNCCKTSMSSKLIGAESEFFSSMCVEAIEKIKVFDHKKRPKYPLGAINIVKAHGSSSLDSKVVDGYVLF